MDTVESEYPKMIYPHGENGEDDPGKVDASGHQHGGVIVQNKEQEDWVRGGNNLDDFGKPPKEKKPAAPPGFK